MKLVRLRINDAFRSLPAGFDLTFRNPAVDPEINLEEPICLVGINGSGKSNVLEALAEIFGYIDQTFLRFVSEHSDSPIINSFELEYLLPITWGKSFMTFTSGIPRNKTYVNIKIVKQNDTKPQYFWTLDGHEYPILEEIQSALPDRIIGYSSGQNELLSISFYRARFRYYNTLLQEQKSTYRDSIEYSRLRYIDYTENASILLSNYLMAKDDEVNIFREKLSIDAVDNFELVINRNQKKRGVLNIDKEIDKLLSFLESRATAYEGLDNGGVWYYFSVTPQLKKELQDNFFDAAGLYTLFKRISFLNLNTVGKSKIDALLSSGEELYETYKKFDFESNDKLFQISEIGVKKSSLDYPISYRNLSDGEHQFIHVIGTLQMMKGENVLFLFDEPETHFNPQWKYEYTQMIKRATNKIKSQIVLTTHDPVLISGLAKENVIVFNKPASAIERTYKPEKNLKGMGVDAILTSPIFGLNSTLDAETYRQVLDRRTLYLKSLQETLTEAENDSMRELSEKLSKYDFTKPYNDPIMLDYFQAALENELYFKPVLTPEELEKRKEFARETLEKLRNK